MNRAALEHVLRAAAAITGQEEFIVVGSQSILGLHPSAPATLLVSDEVDLYPAADPELGELIEGAIGEGSPFHERFGYYAQTVDERTSILPSGWKQRLVRVQNENTRGAIGLCLDPHDLVVAKLLAGREKDLRFARDALSTGLVEYDVLRTRLETVDTDPALLAAARPRLAAIRPR